MTPEVVDIIVVDDNPRNLLALEAVLQSPGLNPVCVSSGAEALGELLRREFAAILLDVQMPEMDGLTTLEALRALDPTARVAMLTANADGEAVRRALALGALDYVLKPFRARRLAEAVDRLLASG